MLLLSRPGVRAPVWRAARKRPGRETEARREGAREGKRDAALAVSTIVTNYEFHSKMEVEASRRDSGSFICSLDQMTQGAGASGSGIDRGRDGCKASSDEV